jgi:hypothetical protein
VTRRPWRRRSGVDRGPRPIGESLDDAVAGFVPPAVATDASRPAEPVTAGALSAVFSRWEEIVGPAVARHVRPIRFSGGALVVAVDQPAWATQVRALGPGLLARVGEVGGVVPERLQVIVKPVSGGR